MISTVLTLSSLLYVKHHVIRNIKPTKVSYLYVEYILIHVDALSIDNRACHDNMYMCIYLPGIKANSVSTENGFLFPASHLVLAQRMHPADVC